MRRSGGAAEPLRALRPRRETAFLSQPGCSDALAKPVPHYRRGLATSFRSGCGTAVIEPHRPIKPSPSCGRVCDSAQPSMTRKAAWPLTLAGARYCPGLRAFLDDNPKATLVCCVTGNGNARSGDVPCRLRRPIIAGLSLSFLKRTKPKNKTAPDYFRQRLVSRYEVNRFQQAVPPITGLKSIQKLPGFAIEPPVHKTCRIRHPTNSF